MFSSKDDYLAKVWSGMPGVETVDFTFNLKTYNCLEVFYNEVQNEYIKNCDKTEGITVFQNFAQKIVDVTNDFNCTNVCIPLRLEPITNTIRSETFDQSSSIISAKIINALF